MQATWSFAIKVVKSSKVVFYPLMNESMLLGLEYSTCSPRCSSLHKLAIIVSMLTNFLQSSWFAGAPQKFKMMRTLLRLAGSSSKLLLHQLQFTISRIIAGIKLGRIPAFHR